MSSQTRFWFVSRPADETTLEWDKAAGRRTAKNFCSANLDHRATGKRLGDLHVVLPDITLKDFVWTWYSDCLIQDKVRRQFAEEAFSGFNTRAVNVRRLQSRDLGAPSLWEMEVTGWGGMASLESGIRRIDRCRICGLQTYTMFTNPERLIDEKEWDGSDFFLVWPMPHFFVTDRVAALIKAEGLTGVCLVEPYRISFPKLIKVFGPLPLRLRFPEDRARRLGEPLDIY